MTEVKVDMGGTKGPVALKLQELSLEQYASAIVDDQGYDTMETLQSMSAEELSELADEVKMKPGHKKKFLSTFGTTAITVEQPAAQPAAQPIVTQPAAPQPVAPMQPAVDPSMVVLKEQMSQMQQMQQMQMMQMVANTAQPQPVVAQPAVVQPQTTGRGGGPQTTGRPPPPGLPPEGHYQTVHYVGTCTSIFCCLLMCGGAPGCLLLLCPCDEKEVWTNSQGVHFDITTGQVTKAGACSC